MWFKKYHCVHWYALSITFCAKGPICQNVSAWTVITVYAHFFQKYWQTHSATIKGGHCDNDHPKLGTTNFCVPVRKWGLSMHPMKLAMRARGLTMHKLNFIAKNTHIGSPSAQINLVHIWVVTYPHIQLQFCLVLCADCLFCPIMIWVFILLKMLNLWSRTLE